MTHKTSMRSILYAFFLVSLFTIAVPNTHAYLTTNQQAEALEGRTGVFLIDYAFGVKKHAVHMPVLAHSGSAMNNTMLSYAIVDTEGKEMNGKSIGIVFSNAPLSKDGMYVIPKNTSKASRLVVIFTPEIGTALGEYRLQVKHLPFSFDGKQQLKLNPSELQYYTTKYISL